jgi:hypothetical protein
MRACLDLRERRVDWWIARLRAEVIAFDHARDFTASFVPDRKAPERLTVIVST